MQFTRDKSGQRSQRVRYRWLLTLAIALIALAVEGFSPLTLLHTRRASADAGNLPNATAQAPRAATVGFGQAAYTGYTGLTFTVDLVVADADSLDGWQAVLVYDPSRLAVETVTPGGFLSSTGRTENALGLSQQEPGRMVIGGYTYGSAPAASGSGLLARLTLRGLAAGQTSLDLADAVLTSAVTPGQLAVSAPGTVGASVTVHTPTASMLALFEAVAQENGILVSWQTVSEIDTRGFNLQRSTSPDGPRDLLVSVPALTPGGLQGGDYQWLDGSVAFGATYYYWLDVISLSGATSSFGPLEVRFDIPTVVTIGELSTSDGRGLGFVPWVVMSVIIAILVIGRIIQGHPAGSS